MCGCMAAQVKVHVCGLGLLRPRLSGGLVCDGNTTEGAMRRLISESYLYLYMHAVSTTISDQPALCIRPYLAKNRNTQ